MPRELSFSVLSRAYLTLVVLMKTGVERVTPDLHLLAVEGCVIGATAGAAVGATGICCFENLGTVSAYSVA